MTFYLAARLDQHAWATACASALVAAGWSLSLDWMRAFRDGAEPALADIATNEIAAVAASDVLVAVLPASIGLHVELGAALALGKRVVIVDREPPAPHPYPCPFYEHPCVVARFAESDPVAAARRVLEVA